MGVTGRTQNKLFKVKSLDRNNLYQVGVNGVLDLQTGQDNITKVIYEIDDIKYTTYLQNKVENNFETREYSNSKKKREVLNVQRNDDNYLTAFGPVESAKLPSTISKKFFINDDEDFNLVRRSFKQNFVAPRVGTEGSFGSSVVGDTIYETTKFSYENFIEDNIFKREDYVGLISKPITQSDLFIERDEIAIFERHQRISEINNLATLENYRNGYYKNIKTL